MNDRIYHALFVCTHDSARSIMAEVLLNGLGRGRFAAHSAGSHPASSVHPLALKRRIEPMLALPLAALDRIALQRELHDIGRR